MLIFTDTINAWCEIFLYAVHYFSYFHLKHNVTISHSFRGRWQYTDKNCMQWVVLRRYNVPRAQISFPGAFDYTWRAQKVLVVLILSFWSNFNPNQLYMCMFVCICIHYECNPWSLERNLNYQWLYKLLPRKSHLLLYFPHNQVSRSVARRKFDGFASYVALERSGGEYHVTTQFYFYPVMSKL